MLVIASSMLRISTPTMMPITRMIRGSNRAVNFRMAALRIDFIDVRHSREHLVEFAGFLADAQQVSRQRRKLPGFLDRPGDAFAALHTLRNELQRCRDSLIVQNRARDGDRLHQRNAVRHQRRHGAGESRRFRLPQGIAEERDFQAECVPPEPAHRRCGCSLQRDNPPARDRIAIHP